MFPSAHVLQTCSPVPMFPSPCVPPTSSPVPVFPSSCLWDAIITIIEDIWATPPKWVPPQIQKWPSPIFMKMHRRIHCCINSIYSKYRHSTYEWPYWRKWKHFCWIGLGNIGTGELVGGTWGLGNMIGEYGEWKTLLWNRNGEHRVWWISWGNIGTGEHVWGIWGMENTSVE